VLAYRPFESADRAAGAPFNENMERFKWLTACYRLIPI
jgi:hypothetical protein